MKPARLLRILVVVLLSVVCGPALRTRRVLRVGVNHAPPYSFIGPDGIPRGFAVGVMREAARRAGLSIRLVVSPEGPDDALASGKVDIWPLVTDIPERHERILFTDAWMRASYVLLVKKESPIQDAAGAAGRILSVSDLPIHVRLARRTFPRSRLAPVPPGNELNQLCDGTADAAVIGRKDMLSRLLHRTAQCESLDLRVVPIREMSYQMSLGASATGAGAFAEAKRLREAISEMSADSTLDRLYREWLNDTADETAIVNELQEATRRNSALYATSLFLTAMVGFLAWLIRRKAAAERAARASSEFTSAVLDTATQTAIVFVDAGRVVRTFNKGAERMLGYRAEEVLGLGTSDLFFDQAEVAARLEALSAVRGEPVLRENLFVEPERESRIVEWTLLRKGGMRIPVALAVSTIHGADGEVRGFLGIAIDISQQKALERELRLNNRQLGDEKIRADTASRAKDQFLANMSHELRTPLNGIIGIAELLAGTRLDTEQRKYVDMFRRAGCTLLALVNDILDLSKIEAGAMELESVEFDPEEAAEETLELVASRALTRKLNLVKRVAPGLPRRVVGDPCRLKQVLMNLLGNAVKFTEAGEVTLELRGCGDVSASGAFGRTMIEFAVRDTGIGISPDKMETIFEDFKQADSSTTRRYGGTGLGLGISRRIVERMGGRLTAASVPGEGSTFTFRLPFGPATGEESCRDRPGLRVLA